MWQEAQSQLSSSEPSLNRCQPSRSASSVAAPQKKHLVRACAPSMAAALLPSPLLKH
jgi:hypothetical protein